MPKLIRNARTRRPFVDVLETRITPAGPSRVPPPGAPPLAVNDGLGYNFEQPSNTVSVLANDLDGNPGATWDFSSLTVVSPPAFGALTLDPQSGVFLYTPNYLLPPGLPPGATPPPAQQDQFTYNVKNSLGMQSNTATTILSPVGAEKVGSFVAAPDIAFTNSYQPVTIDVLANDVIFDGSNYDYASVKLSDNAFYTPKHGTVTFDPKTGKATYTPSFGYIGFDIFSYSAATTSGAQDTDLVYVIINATPPRLQPDPNGGGQMLVVDGTRTADVISIVPGDRRNQVQAIVNGVASPSFRPTSRVVVFGYGGDDTITVSPRVHTPVWLVGGVGNDVLTAGGGPALLMGSEGNDTLNGGRDRDLLIGGLGEDNLSGSFSSDLLVGGTTTMDQQPEQLGQVFDSWVWNPSYFRSPRRWECQRTHDRLSNTDVLDDGAKDTVNGGPGRDLILGADGVPPDDVIDPPSGKHDGKGRSRSRC
jgi:Ca2+-binding RTX toxin-like protein